jgi:hypothetical protein
MIAFEQAYGRSGAMSTFDLRIRRLAIELGEFAESPPDVPAESPWERGFRRVDGELDGQ